MDCLNTVYLKTSTRNKKHTPLTNFSETFNEDLALQVTRLLMTYGRTGLFQKLQNQQLNIAYFSYRKVLLEISIM